MIILIKQLTYILQTLETYCYSKNHITKLKEKGSVYVCLFCNIFIILSICKLSTKILYPLILVPLPQFFLHKITKNPISTPSNI